MLRVSYAVTLALVCAAAASPVVAGASGPCPKPQPGLKGPTQDVDARTVPFSVDGTPYQLDIYSGYAAQSDRAGSLYCVRYEVENRSAADIDILTWPLPGVVVRKLKPGPEHRQSWIKTIGTSPPMVKDTALYAFKSQTLKSKAYKEVRKQAPTSNLLQLTAGQLGNDFSVLPERGTPRPIAVGAEAPSLGAAFTGSGETVSVSSAVRRSPDGYFFSLSIQHVGSEFAPKIFAPFVSAMSAVKDPSLLEQQVKEAPVEALAIGDGAVEVNTSFAPFLLKDPYIVEHPITVVLEESVVCFLTPSYSPAPISPDVLKCE